MLLRTRAREHARAHTTAFGLFWRRSRMSWIQWDGVVDLVDEPLSLLLGVESDEIIPRARPLSLAMKQFPDVFKTTLELPANSATHVARDGTVSLRRRPEALFDFDFFLRAVFARRVLSTMIAAATATATSVGGALVLYYALLIDAAQYARGRVGTDGTNVLLSALWKRRVGYRTEQCLVLGMSLTKDDAKVFKPHIDGSSPAVDSLSLGPYGGWRARGSRTHQR